LITFAVSLATTAGLVLLFPVARTAYPAIPTPLLIGLNLIRVAGVLLVLPAAAGRLAGPFPHVAGWGDFVTGALAIPVAWLATAKSRHHDRLVVAWNAFGASDLVVAVTLGDHVEERISVAANSRRGWHRGDDNPAMVVGPFDLGTVLPHSPRDRIRLTARSNFSENNRKVDFDERLQSSALTPAAWPTSAQSTSSTGRREQRRLIRSPQRRISLSAE
jgi:hypothetical protein